jgi:hypothetical protein
MSRRNIFLVGSGSLAKAIVDALSTAPLHDLGIHIYSRETEKSNWLATIGNTRSFAFHVDQKYYAGQVDWQTELPLSEEMARIRPALVIHAASLQSMWTLARKNRWSDLVKKAGYGVTLPLQCVLATRIGKTIAAQQEPPLFINCCYPDAVNYVLAKCGLDVLCGIGNIGIIDNVLSTQNLPPYRMLANHYHLQQLVKPPSERTELPRLWVEGKEVDARPIFDPVRLVNDPSLNSITSISCVKLLSAILNKENTLLHLPAPNGLPGGYPVEIREGRIAATGTGFLEPQEERSWNKKILENEGLVFGEDGMLFSGTAFEGIHTYSPELAKGFTFIDAASYFAAFTAFVQDLSS